MTHDQYHLLFGGSCGCLLYQQGECDPGATFLWLDMSPFEEQLFCEAPQEKTRNTRTRMLRAERIRVPGSKEASSFRSSIGFLRVWVFLPSVGNVGWFTTACLKIAEQRLFYICASFRMCGLYRDKSDNALVVIDTTVKCRSVISCFWLILSRLCLLGQPHMSAFFTL